jgi:hypothetical protein
LPERTAVDHATVLAPPAESGRAPPQASDATPTQTDEIPLAHLLRALDQASDEEGWAQLSAFGSYLTKLQPDFDARLYGFRKLSDLVRARKDMFEVEDRAPPGAQGKALYLRRRHEPSTDRHRS